MKYSESEVIDAIKEAADVYGPEIGIRDYREYRQKFNKDLPSLHFITDYFGKWNDVKEKAGLELNNKQFSKQEIINIVRKASKETEQCLSQPVYRQWRSRQKGNYPASTQVANKLGGGSWNKMKENLNLPICDVWGVKRELEIELNEEEKLRGICEDCPQEFGSCGKSKDDCVKEAEKVGYFKEAKKWVKTGK